MAGGAGGGGGGDGGGQAPQDQRELVDDYRDMIEAATLARQSEIMTALPIKFEEYDNKKQTAKVKILVKTTVMKPDGTAERREYPALEERPVYWLSGGREDDQGGQGGAGQQAAGGSQKKKGYMLTTPIKKGDEGIAIFSARTLDKWHKEGDVQEQVIARMHDLNDAMILPGIKSQPRAEEVEGGTDNEKAHFRSVDGKHKYGIFDDADGGLEQDTEANLKSNAKKNVETKAGELHTTESKEMKRTIEKTEYTQAGKAIVKRSPKIFWN